MRKTAMAGILLLIVFAVASCSNDDTTSSRESTLPQVSIQTPWDGTTREGIVDVLIEATDNAGIENVEFYAADLSKDISDQPWANRKYNKIMLDPSRAGASEVLHHFKKWQPEQIVYVSCNPSTLARDAGILVNELGYKLVKAGVMDMFPQTGHVESIALFEKR